MNLEVLKEVIAIFEQSTVGTLEVEENGMKIKVEKARAAFVPSNSEVQSSAVEIQNIEMKNEFKSSKSKKMEENNSNYLVKSPLVGIYYGCASPEEKPFINIGNQVKKGDILCIIEAMKMMNEVVAPVSGKIVKIYHVNEDLVEFSAPIIEIEENHV